jgi:hypothetical protein
VYDYGQDFERYHWSGSAAAPLANNGGTTETQALGLGSPALAAGNPAKPNKKGSGGKCLATDQIGDTRTKGLCDIGARQQSGLI